MQPASRVANSCSHLLVKEEEAKAVSDPLQLCDCVSDALDGGHLILKELVDKVREVRVSLGVRGLGDLLEDTATASLALIGHQLHPMLSLLLRLLRKVSREAGQGLVVSR